MVEFAIVATVLLTLLLGIIEFSRALYMYHTVSNAARIGARWAMVRGSFSCSALYPVDHCNASPSAVQSYVRSVVPLSDSGTLNVATAWSTSTYQQAACPSPPNPGPGSLSPGTNAQDHLVCVTVTYPFTFAIPLVSGATWNLSSTSQMFISQ
jgi:Flp pilus assembly protein TadG